MALIANVKLVHQRFFNDSLLVSLIKGCRPVQHHAEKARGFQLTGGPIQKILQPCPRLGQSVARSNLIGLISVYKANSRVDLTLERRLIAVISLAQAHRVPPYTKSYAPVIPCSR